MNNVPNEPANQLHCRGALWSNIPIHRRFIIATLLSKATNWVGSGCWVSSRETQQIEIELTDQTYQMKMFEASSSTWCFNFSWSASNQLSIAFSSQTINPTPPHPSRDEQMLLTNLLHQNSDSSLTQTSAELFIFTAYWYNRFRHSSDLEPSSPFCVMFNKWSSRLQNSFRCLLVSLLTLSAMFNLSDDRFLFSSRSRQSSEQWNLFADIPQSNSAVNHSIKRFVVGKLNLLPVEVNKISSRCCFWALATHQKLSVCLQIFVRRKKAPTTPLSRSSINL